MNSKNFINPEIYLILATSTNAGKTRLCVELIKVLSKRARTIGFKPYGGLKLLETLDFLISANKNKDGLIYGPDATALCDASPLTTQDDIEVIAPSYRISRARLESSLAFQHELTVPRAPSRLT